MSTEYKIVQVALPVGHVHYPRPGIVVCLVSSTHKVLAISSKMDLYRRDQHFLISKDNPDFGKTGLSTDSYAIGAPVFEVESDEIIRELGVLAGQLAIEFSRWID